MARKKSRKSKTRRIKKGTRKSRKGKTRKSKKSKKKSRKKIKTRKSTRKSRKSTRKSRKSTHKKPNKGKTYHVMYNGGNTYDVTVGKSTAIIEDVEKDKGSEIFRIKKSFAGADSDGKKKGNTVLLQLSPTKYISIASKALEFTTDSPIVKYESFIGNSAVPYPVAYTKDKVYLTIENVSMKKSDLKDWKGKGSNIYMEDLYSIYYDKLAPGKKYKTKQIKFR